MPAADSYFHIYLSNFYDFWSSLKIVTLLKKNISNSVNFYHYFGSQFLN